MAVIDAIAITRDAVYITDSFQAQFYRIALLPCGKLPATPTVQTIPLTGDFQLVTTPGAFNSNGIVASPNGKYLIIVHIYNRANPGHDIHRRPNSARVGPTLGQAYRERNEKRGGERTLSLFYRIFCHAQGRWEKSTSPGLCQNAFYDII